MSGPDYIHPNAAAGVYLMIRLQAQASEEKVDAAHGVWEEKLLNGSAVYATLARCYKLDSGHTVTKFDIVVRINDEEDEEDDQEG